MREEEEAMSPMPWAVASMLMRLAVSSPDREICGFITKDWNIRVVENIAQGGHDFEMDPDRQLSIYREYGRDGILGVYHSHPSGRQGPSDTDITFAPPWFRYWIVTFDAVTEWEIRDGCATELAAPIHRSPEQV